MKKILIKIRNGNGNLIDKDIFDTTGNERLQWYNSSTKSEMAIMVENLYKSIVRRKK